MLLNSEGLKRIIGRYHERLATYRDAINRLNVYPVPDGDTGTNMSLTMGTVVDHVRDATGMEEVIQAIAHGSLMGARGNSGVILSQILRGLADTFRGTDEVGSQHMAKALETASAAAYRAVLRPVEGTILTVLREAAEEALEEEAGEDLGELLKRVYRRAETALERTPELLPVLKQAGVVDAGGAGLLLLLAAFVEEVTGNEVQLPEELLWAEAALEAAGSQPSLRYEVMFFLEADDHRLDAFRDRWAELGDSIVVVGGGGEYNCHIHTDHIGAAIEAGVAAGRPYSIRVTDLREQAEAERFHRPPRFSPLPEVGQATIGVVAVVVGDGLVESFRGLGAQGVVSGGQTMNPSTEDLLSVVEAVPALTVVVLPNNKNIIPVAEQVDALTPKHVLVVPTRSVAEGLAAMVAYRPSEGDSHSLVEDMSAAASAVSTGEITRAVRDAVVEVGTIKQGDWLGLADGRIAVVNTDLFQTVVDLLGHLAPPETEVVTIFTGEGAERAVTKAVEAWLDDARPLMEVQILEGGQPLYPYLISVE